MALSLTTATNGTLIYTTSPILVLVIERLVFGKPLPAARLLGVVLAMAGVAVIVLKGDLTALARLDFNLGDIGIAAAALAWAGYSLVLRNETLARVPTLPLFAVIAMVGVLTLLPFSAVELATVGGWPMRPGLWAAVGGLALFSAVGAFSLYQYGVKVVGPAVTSCFLYLLPVYGVGMSVAFLGEAFGIHHLVGMALVLVGLLRRRCRPTSSRRCGRPFMRKLSVRGSLPLLSALISAISRPTLRGCRSPQQLLPESPAIFQLMPSRRDLLASLLAAPAALTLNRTALAQGSPLQAALAAVSDGQAISRDALLAFAREVSRNPYQAPRADVPRSLQQLSLDQYRQIRMKPDQRFWAGENRGFTLDLLPAGNVFTTPVTIRTVDGGIIRDKRFQADQYDYGQTAPLPTEIQVPYTAFAPMRG